MAFRERLIAPHAGMRPRIKPAQAPIRLWRERQAKGRQLVRVRDPISKLD
jgi:hypothetical protein